MDNSNLIDFLKPYLKSMVPAGAFKAYLCNSTLYTLYDNAVLSCMGLPSMVDPHINISINELGLCNVDNSWVYQKYISILPFTHIDNMVYDDPNLMEDKYFEEIVLAKSTEGAKWYFINTSIDTIFVPVYNGLPSVKKGDHVRLRVFNIDHIRNDMYLINYTISKKKLNISYDLYYQILNVNHPLR